MTVELDASTSVTEFFQDAVASAVESEGYDTTRATELYVAALLADYARPDTAQQLLREPVGVALVKALHTPSIDRFDRLRTLGDEVLFVTGFFTEHLERRGLESSYFRELGAVAYDGAAQTLKRVGSATQGPDVFVELAQNFAMFSDLLRTVADLLHARSVATPGSLLELYERWQRSGSAVLSDALARFGLAPLAGDKTLH